MSLSLPQPIHTVFLWHSWVGNARGGPCMNCSFRRWIEVFFRSSVLLSTVTVHCGTSCWYSYRLWRLRFHLALMKSETQIHSQVFQSVGECWFPLKGVKSYVLVTYTFICLIVIFLWNPTYQLTAREPDFPESTLNNSKTRSLFQFRNDWPILRSNLRQIVSSVF